MDIV